MNKIDLKRLKNQLILNTNYYPYFHYKKAINESKGIIFFVHGYASNSLYNLLFVNQLSDYDYISVELPGNNISPVNNIKDLTPIKLAEMVANLIQSLNLKDIYLIGHSMGGGIANMINHLIPSRIRKMILVCPMNTLGTFDLYHFLFSFNPTTYKKAVNLCKYLLYDDSLLSIDQADIFIKQMVDLNIKTKKYQHHLKYQMASIKNLVNMNKNEKNDYTKTLLIVCKNDKCINYKRTIFNLKKKNKKLEIKILDKCGHAPMIEKSIDFYNEIIKFIKK